MLNPQLLTTFSAIVSAGRISAVAARLEADLEADLSPRLIQRTNLRPVSFHF